MWANSAHEIAVIQDRRGRSGFVSKVLYAGISQLLISKPDRYSVHSPGVRRITRICVMFARCTPKVESARYITWTSACLWLALEAHMAKYQGP